MVVKEEKRLVLWDSHFHNMIKVLTVVVLFVSCLLATTVSQQEQQFSVAS